MKNSDAPKAGKSVLFNEKLEFNKTMKRKSTKKGNDEYHDGSRSSSPDASDISSNYER